MPWWIICGVVVGILLFRYRYDATLSDHILYKEAQTRNDHTLSSERLITLYCNNVLQLSCTRFAPLYCSILNELTL